MNNSHKRKNYMKNVYSKTWSKKRKEYGLAQYDKDLIQTLTKELKNGKILSL